MDTNISKTAMPNDMLLQGYVDRTFVFVLFN